MRIVYLLTLITLAITQLTLVSQDVLQIPVNTDYNYSFSATGGQSPYTYSTDTLPTGLALNGSTISGKSTTIGVFPLVITVKDANQASANKHIFIYITSPNSQSNSQKSTVTTVTTTTTQASSGQSGIPAILPISSSTQGSLNQNSAQSSQQISSTNLQSNTQSSFVDSGSRVPQGIVSSTSTPFNPSLPERLTPVISSTPSPVYGNNFNPVTITVSPNTIPNSFGPNPSSSLPRTPSVVPNIGSGVLIVPTTTPYITNYSFASSLQNTPTLTSTEPSTTAFQRQADINRVISSLLSVIQNYNATLLGLQSNIPNTTSLLNDAIRNQRVAQAQVNAIVAQNNTISNNISGIESGIKTLQNQMLSTTNTLNNSQAQVKNFQSKITQNYIQINDTQNRLNQANNSLQMAIQKQAQTSAAINRSKSIILSLTQNITSIQNDIDNSPTYLAKLSVSINNQKSVILALQKQLKDAILALSPLQQQFDYYTMIPTTGPGLIQQNRTILLSETANIAQAQPIYDSSDNDIRTYTDLLNQLKTNMNSLQNQLSADKLAYNNLMGSQNNQEGLFNNTLLTIASQTQLLNKAKQQQNQLMTGPYNAALQVVSDTTSKVDQLTATLQSLNKRYQSVQNDLASTQQTLNQALQQKDLADQAVNQVIQVGGGNRAALPLSSLSSSSGAANININISGSTP